MPRVPTYNPTGTVKEAGLPNVRVNTQADPASFGIDRQTPQAINQFNAGVQKIIQAEKEKADKTHVKSIYEEGINKKLELTTGFRKLQGKQAAEAFTDYEDKWKEAEDELRGQVKNQAQQMAVDGILLRMKSEYMNTLHGHTSIQNKAYAEQKAKSLTTTLIRDGVANASNKEKFKQVHDDVKKNIISDYVDRGMGETENDPVIKEALQDAFGKLHMGVIGEMLANEQGEMAKEHFYKHKDEMAPDVAAQARKAIETSSILGKSQQIADEVMSKAKTYGQAIKMAREKAGNDSRLKEDLNTRMKMRWAEHKAIKEENQDAMSLDVINGLKKNPEKTPMEIAGPKWDLLDLEHQKSVISFRRDDLNDDNKFKEFINLSTDEMAKLSEKKYQLKYWNNFDSYNRGMADKIYQHVKKNGAGSSKSKNLISYTKHVKDALRKIQAISRTKTDSQLSSNETLVLINSTNAAVERYWEFVEKNKGQLPTELEQMEIINKYIGTQMIKRGRFWDSQTPIAKVKTESELIGAQVPLHHTTPQYKSIARRMADNGIVPTQSLVEQAYAAHLAGPVGENLFLRLVGDQQ